MKKTKEKTHIHTWNKYNHQGRCCCSTCDLDENEYRYIQSQKTKPNTLLKKGN